MNPLLKLSEYGQSYWLDNLSRKMIIDGMLKKRVTEQGLRGVTSNPTIFNNAISKSSDYDEQIKLLVKKGNPIAEIYQALVVKDVQDACDILGSVYEKSNGLDGYVSLEVSPYLARHALETMEEARRLFKAVNRPNCMIKIPGTVEGFPAIEQMIYEGVNVNITLLFSIQHYEAVAKAYIRALERRAAENKDVNNVASVASFFVSRIDVLVDQLLNHRILPGKDDETTHQAKSLLGKLAVASGKLAYQSYKKIFSGDRWEALVQKSARVQRPLWASTSTKNPEYYDACYVEPLIGKNTVNTMPDDTIEAFADHGKIVEDAVERNIEEARESFDMVEKLGISMNYVTRRLEDEGIQKFIDPFNVLMDSIAKKREQFL
jgi:transaldolase